MTRPTFFSPSDMLTSTEREHGTTLAPRFDANGLATAVTVDHVSGEVLMVAHLDAQALALSIETGFAHYYSRSRRSIWKKGESSGELQRIVEIRTDCDQDAFVLRVEQLGHGAACHTGKRSCFYRAITTADGEPRLVDADVPQLFDPRTVYKA
jgi:phosphoribosyl-AMP cyclohydrolase